MSTFLAKADYDVLIEEGILDQVIEADDQLEVAETYAQAQITTYLGARFNTNEIFAQTGDDRNAMVKMVMIDIALYHLHARIAPGDVSEVRVERYKDALEWCRDARDGILETGLPVRLDDNSNPINRLRFGSNDKMNHHY